MPRPAASPAAARAAASRAATWPRRGASTIALFLLGALAPAAAQDRGAAEDAPRAALEQMSAALRAIAPATYRARALVSHALENLSWRVEGTVELAASSEARRARVLASVRAPGADAPARQELLLGPRPHLWIDHGKREWSEIDGARACDRLGGALLAPELLEPEALGAFLRAGALREVGATTLAGEPVRELVWSAPDGRSERRWLVSERDQLPRQIERSRRIALGETERVRTTILAWEGPPSAPLAGATAPPDGYRRLDAPEPAPDAPAGPPVEVADLSTSLAPLTRSFEASRARLRVIALLAPS
jgi:hypothetical protein